MSVMFKSKELFCSASMIYFCSHNIVSVYLQIPCTMSLGVSDEYKKISQNEDFKAPV